MTRPDHYATLGVDRQATPAEILRAYRKAAAAAHPDRGGTTERMQAVNAAKDVLMDPKRRAAYDAGGGDEESPESFVERVARRVIRDLFTRAINDNVLNPYEATCGGIRNGRKESSRRISDLQGAIKRLNKQRGRVVTKSGANNAYTDIIDSAIASATNDIANMMETIQAADRALEIMAEEYGPGAEERNMQAERMMLHGSLGGAVQRPPDPWVPTDRFRF